jgi:hypothetical protein
MEIFYNINFIDETGIWPNVWKILSEQLNLHFLSIKYKEKVNSKKSLNQINIKMHSNLTNFSLQIFVLKINNHNDLKSILKDKIDDYLKKNKDPFVVILNEFDNNESSIAKCVKSYEKMKNDLNTNSVFLLPINVNQTKVREIIYEFFKEFNSRISSDITNTINNLYKTLAILRQKRNDSKEASFNYLQTKENVLNYLYFLDFSEESIKINEEDLFISCDKLDIKTPFDEPINLIGFDENKLRLKINNMTVSYLEYIQFLIFQILKINISLMNLKRLNSCIVKVLSDFYLIKNLFYSSYHFNFFFYIYLNRISDYLRTIKTDLYNIEDQEIKSKLLMLINYQMKKTLKNLSMLLQYELPSFKSFCIILNNLKDNNVSVPYQYSQMDNNLLYLIKEVKEKKIDEKFKRILESKENFYEEYLLVINNIEQIHIYMNQNRSSIKLQLEKIPILFIINKIILVKEILLKCLNCLKKEKWSFINEFFQTLFIFYLVSQETTSENFSLLFNEALTYSSTHSKVIQKILKIKKENILFDSLTQYFSSFKHNQFQNKIEKINLSNMLIIEISPLNENDFSNSNKTRQFNVSLKSYMKFSIPISNIFLILQNNLENRIIKIDSNIERFELTEGTFSKSCNIDTSNIDSESGLILLRFEIVFECGIEGIVEYDKNKFSFNISNSEIRFDYKLINPNSNRIYFLDTIYHMVLILKDYQILNKNDLKIALGSINSDDVMFHDCKIFNATQELDDYSFLAIQKQPFDHQISINKEYKYKVRHDIIKIKKKNNIKIKKELLIIVCSFSFTDENHDFEFKDSSLELSIIKLGEKVNLDDSDTLIHKNKVDIKIQRLFTITPLLRSLRTLSSSFTSDDKEFLLQTTFSTISPFPIYLSKSIEMIEKFYADDYSKANFVNLINRVNENQTIKYYFEYENSVYTYILPTSIIQTCLNKCMNYDYEIRVISDLENTDIPIYKELKINVSIKKNLQTESTILVKLKESPGWIIIGKTKIIEKIFPSDILNLTFCVVPIVDGNIRIPEFEFTESVEYKGGNERNSSLHLMEFPSIKNYLIEGNKKIVKVNPINNFQMKMNVF